MKLMNNPKILLIFIILFFGIFGLVNSSEAANRYVRQGATGSANGTDWTNAYTSLPATLTRGDTYYIADGSYIGYNFDDAVSGSLVITIKKATISDHGTNIGWQSSYGDGQAVFNGQLAFNSSYWVVDGITGGGPGSWDTGFGIKVIETGDTNAIIKIGTTSAESKYHDITVSHVEMQGKGSVSSKGGSASNDGVGLYGGSSFTLSYAWMHGIGRCPVFGYSRGVTVLEYIYVSSYYGSDAVHSEVASLGQGSVADFTWRYSLFTDIQSTGGIMWNNAGNHSAHLYIYGNTFYRPSGAIWSNGNGVIGGWTGSNGQDCYGMRIYNNTFINVNIRIFTDFMWRTGDNIAYNNVFYNSSSPGYSNIQIHDYNHYINSGTTQGEANGTSATSGDPFVDYANLNFMLSAATTAGTTLPSPFNSDSLGNSRGADGTWDRGTYEYIASGPQPDTIPPVRANGSPTGQLSAGTTQATLSLTTDENATCKYSLTAGTAYSAMTNTFSTTGAINHSTNVSGLTNGSSYNYYIRCQDTTGNSNTTDFPISFSIASGNSGNLLSNPDFEGGFTNNLASNWNITTDGSVGYSISQDAGYQGSAQKIIISSPGSWGLFYYQTLSFQLNQSYNWSFWYKTEGTGSLWAQMTNAPHTQVVHSESLPPTNNQWIYKTIPFQYTNSLSNQLRFSSNATSSYWIDDVQLAVALPSQDITPPSAPSGVVVY